MIKKKKLFFLASLTIAFVFTAVAYAMSPASVSAHGPSSNWKSNGLCPYWADYRITVFEHSGQNGKKDSACMGSGWYGTKKDNNLNGNQRFRDVGEVNSMNGIVTSFSVNTGSRDICVYLYSEKNLGGNRIWTGYFGDHTHTHTDVGFWANDQAKSMKITNQGVNHVEDC